MAYVVAALYHFANVTDPDELVGKTRETCRNLKVRGTLLVATEGINGTIAGSREGIDGVLAFLRSYPGLAGLEYKESMAHKWPFWRLKVKRKTEIVTLRQPQAQPTERVGTYVEPQDWNELISSPDVITVDTRNDFEYRVGHFEGAVDPQTRAFVDFPEYVEKNLDPKKHKKVAMYCTGGIRCEKATSYMLARGFEEVFHLKGGILKYLEHVPEEGSRWRGECFVFDQRVSVGHGLKQGELRQCFGCRAPLTDADLNAATYEEGVSCSYCASKLTEARRQARRERHKQVLLAEARGQEHLGDVASLHEDQHRAKMQRKDQARARDN